MKLTITRFPLSHFDELEPLLVRCFPNFWKPRLKRGLRSFPYDLKLFTAKIDGRMIGTVGIHDYRFECCGKTMLCGGLSDVGIDPDSRGHGYARQLQEFALAYCRKNYPDCPIMPLYTDKPGVYLSQGWQLYEPDRSREIRTEDFPKHDAFRLDHREIGIPGSEEHKIACRIRKIYRDGQQFNGKCIRSKETWLELFAEPEHEWVLEKDTWFLYRKERLLEAYSLDSDHPVRGFVPVQGGHNDNKLMICVQAGTGGDIAGMVRKKSLLFPIADTF